MIADLTSTAVPLGTLATVDEIISAVSPVGARVDLTGAAGGALGLLAVRVVARTRRSVVIITPDERAARHAAADVSYFASELGEGKGPTALLYPDHDLPVYSALRPDRRNVLKRLAVLAELLDRKAPVVLVVPAPAFRRLVIPRETFVAQSFRLEVAGEVDRDELIDRLVVAGYRRTPLVSDRGTFAVRGALLDIFPPRAPEPVRVELDFDLVERIRTFDAETQLTTGERDEVRIEPASEVIRGEAELACAMDRIQAACDEVDLPTVRAREMLEAVQSGSSMFSFEGWLPAFHDRLDELHRYLPEGSIVVVDDPAAVLGAWVRQDEAAAKARAGAREQGDPTLPPEEHLAMLEVARERVETRSHLLCHQVATAGDDPWDAAEALDVGAGGHDALRRALRHSAAGRGGEKDLFSPLAERVTSWLDQALAVRLVAHTPGQAERMHALLRGVGLDAHLIGDPSAAPRSNGEIQIVVGALSRGVLLPGEGSVWVAEEEIFGRHGRRRRRRRHEAAAEAFDDLAALEPGQLVVHVDHGIGRYIGLVRREVVGVEMEFLHLEYLGGDRLYLPVHRLNQIHRYVGGEQIKLDRLGGQTFAKRKKKARERVQELADDLLRVQAERAALPGVSCGPPDPMFVQLEATFPYDETEEQQRAIDDVLADLESERVMDRLVCGDVGFGKTEVAIRAAFRVALSGRQVAVLVPTTVLAQQHYQTFRARLSNLPVRIEVLSRFRKPKEQTAILRDLKTGAVDILVGTHRLLSRDVHFKSLGLLVVDEEHRFGVEHKERLKKLKSQVDVLTLSATPIPRTLQMALSDLRDLSLITTPPEGRRPIRTYVSKLDDTIVRDAIRRELARGGQVYYIRNRVQGLRERADHIAALVPEATVAVGHGQMSERALEEVMIDFVEGRTDVLVCTTIVESGLDVPRANTILIERADQLGLAQLYHIRGRVGRAQERAFAYLLVPPAGAMSDDGKRRIAALQRLTELGSGFSLAMMDLEIRGAGELLGVEQSGEVAAVGYQMYVELLEEAISELRGEVRRPALDPELTFDMPAFVPEEHVPETGQRLSLYKRLAGAEDVWEVQEIAAEVRDRFGPPPPPLETLFRMMELKTAARSLGALGVEGTRTQVTIHLSDETKLKPQRVLELVTAPKSPYRVTPDMRLRYKVKPGRFSDSIEAADHVVQELLALLDEDEA